MEKRFDKDKLTLLLEDCRLQELHDALAPARPADIAHFLSGLESEQAVLGFRTLPREQASQVLAELDRDLRRDIIDAATDAELSEIVEELYVGDAVEMLEGLPAHMVQRVLCSARPQTRALINQSLNYPENSAGSRMTTEFTDLRAGMTVAQAIEHIRCTGEDRKTIYTCYVMDASRRLEGVVSVKDLLLAADEMLVRDLMNRDVVSVSTKEDQETAARLMDRYDYLSLPVMDEENRMVGIITVDDAIDVLQQGTTEDMQVMGAMRPSERPYLRTGVLALAKNRIVWLLVLMISGMLTGGILGRYEAAFASMPLLVTFIPMLTDTGGNAGSQSSTLVIRGIAVGEITWRDLPAVFWKELRVAALVGAILSGVNYLRLIITYPGNGMVAFTVALTMFSTVLMAKTIGGVLPLVAHMLKTDPAIMASPLITTIVDALSLILYFNIAQRLLPM